MRFLLLFLVLMSCGEQNTDVSVEETQEPLQFDPAISQMELRGEATKFNTEWIAYQKFITELENFDHTTAAAQRLIVAIDDMGASLPEELTQQPVQSRLKVLETRVKSYHALLTHNSYDSMVQQNRFDQLILALDELKIQMMEVFQFRKAEENILKNLEEMEQDLDEEDAPNSL